MTAMGNGRDKASTVGLPLLTEEGVGQLLAENGRLREKIDGLSVKMDQLISQQQEDEREKAVNRFVFRAGAAIIGLLATSAITVSGWALARSETVAVLETEQAAIRSTLARQDRAIDEADDEVDALARDMSAIRTDVAHMTTLLNNQITRLDTVLEGRHGGR